MREGWEVKALKDVCQIRPPKREAKEALEDNDSVSFVPMKVLGENKKLFNVLENKKLSEVTSSYTYFKNNDVLLAKITPCFENGKLGIAKDLTNGIGFGSSEYIVYRALENLNPEYLYYFLSQESFRNVGKSKMIGAVGHKRIPKDFYELYSIPIPPLTEQTQIVKILDNAFKQIDQAKAKLEKNLHNAKELFQSKLNEVFSQRGEDWEEKTLEEITSKIGSGSTPRGGQASYKESGISLIRSMNVHDDGFREKKLAFIDDEQALKLKNVTLQKNDILLNITGASVARCCIVPDKYLPARVNQHVSIIRLEKDILHSSYLHYCLTAQENKNKLLNIGRQGATREAITKVQIENFVIFYPKNMNKQLEILKSLNIFKEKSETLQTHYQQKLNNLEELKKSILQKAFRGEL